MFSIVDVGKKMALYDDGNRISPVVDRITYNDGLYYFQDHFKLNYFRKEQDVYVNFCINDNGRIKGPIFNSYFSNVDYVSGLAYYDRYLNNLKNRIYFHSMREYFGKDKSIRKKIK